MVRRCIAKHLRCPQVCSPGKDLICHFDMVATGQEMVREKKIFKVREMSGNFILGQGKLAF